MMKLPSSTEAESATPKGLSRAAKKRAKKKQKQREQQQQQQQNTSETEDLKEAIETRHAAVADAAVNAEKPAKKPRIEDSNISNEKALSESKPVPVASLKEPPPFASASTIPNFASLLEIVQPTSNDTRSCRERATEALAFLLAPSGMTVSDFYAKYWEQQPVCIKDSSRSAEHVRRFDGLLSLATIRDLSKRKRMYYGRDLNVTRYERDSDGVQRRITLDLVPAKAAKDSDNVDDLYVQADPEVVWSHYQQGCTVRLLCPHKQSDSVHALLSLLELEWGCMVGANAYLTPPSGAQGFAPHYDDIEAFCLQLQGRKRWKVYEPLHKEERLPRVSSADYTTEDLRDAQPVMDVVLEPGDLLYMPRGWIHQACTLPNGTSDKDGHSLHLTVSAMQQWAWADLLEMLMPDAVEAAAASESTLLREGLPRNFLQYMGTMNDNRDTPDALKRPEWEDPQDTEQAAQTRQWQDDFRNQAKKRILNVAKHAMDMIDVTCDEMGKRFLSDRLPPALTESERASTGGDAEQKLEPTTLCRLVRPGIARLVVEDSKAVLYHCMDNSRVYHETPLSPMEFELDDAPAMEQLLTSFPNWISVHELIHDSIEDKMGVAQALFGEGILSIKSNEETET